MPGLRCLLIHLCSRRRRTRTRRRSRRPFSASQPSSRRGRELKRERKKKWKWYVVFALSHVVVIIQSILNRTKRRKISTKRKIRRKKREPRRRSPNLLLKCFRTLQELWRHSWKSCLLLVGHATFLWRTFRQVESSCLRMPGPTMLKKLSNWWLPVAQRSTRRLNLKLQSRSNGAMNELRVEIMQDIFN